MPLDISCAFFTEALEIGAVCHFDQDELPAAPQDAWVKPMSIMPAAAKEHLRLPGNHNVQPRTDHRQKTQLVLGICRCRELLIRGHGFAPPVVAQVNSPSA
jgi:hypothetical protein